MMQVFILVPPVQSCYTDAYSQG